MYDKFFSKLMQMKEKQVQEVSQEESKRLEGLKEQFQKLEQEWENQKEILKEAKRPTEKKSIKEKARRFQNIQSRYKFLEMR